MITQSPNKTAIFKFILAHHGNCVQSLAQKRGGEIGYTLASFGS